MYFMLTRTVYCALSTRDERCPYTNSMCVVINTRQQDGGYNRGFGRRRVAGGGGAAGMAASGAGPSASSAAVDARRRTLAPPSGRDLDRRVDLERLGAALRAGGGRRRTLLGSRSRFFRENSPRSRKRKKKKKRTHALMHA